MRDEEREILRRRVGARLWGEVERGANRAELLNAYGLHSQKVATEEKQWGRAEDNDWIKDHVEDAGDDALTTAFRQLYPDWHWEPCADAWDVGRFHLFASHSSADQVFVSQVRDALHPLGIDLFVAHVDIEPSAEWLKTLEVALSTCHAILAFLTKSFPGSKWTDQEVGIAYARKALILPLKLGETPYGFMGQFQALRQREPTAIAEEAFSAILRHADVWPMLAESLLSQAEEANAYDDVASQLEKMLRLPFIPKVLADSLRYGEHFNGQFSGRNPQRVIARLLSAVK